MQSHFEVFRILGSSVAWATLVGVLGNDLGESWAPMPRFC